jgi:hypothetical protein
MMHLLVQACLVMRYCHFCDASAFQKIHITYSHSKEHNSKFFGDRYTILEVNLSKRVHMHPLVPSSAAHASSFIRHRRLCDFSTTHCTTHLLKSRSNIICIAAKNFEICAFVHPCTGDRIHAKSRVGPYTRQKRRHIERCNI